MYAIITERAAKARSCMLDSQLLEMVEAFFSAFKTGSERLSLMPQTVSHFQPSVIEDTRPSSYLMFVGRQRMTKFERSFPIVITPLR